MNIIFSILLFGLSSNLFAESNCTGTPKETKVLGTYQGTKLTLKVYYYEEGENPDFHDCTSLEYVFKGKPTAIDLSQSDVREKSFNSATLKDGKVVLVENYSSKSMDAQTTYTTTYSLNLATGLLKELSFQENSPSKDEHAKIKTLLKAGKIIEVLPLIRDMDRDPTGNWNVTTYYFELYTPMVLGILKSKGAQERSSLAKKWVEAWLSETVEESSNLGDYPWYYQFSGRGVQLWNDLAFYLEQGGELALAEKILHWVIKESPGRYVAHLNLSDVYQKQKKTLEAEKHRYIHSHQSAAFQGKPLPTATAPAFTVEEKRKWLGYELLPQCLNFTQKEFAPFQFDRENEAERPARFLVPRVACFRGLPLDQKTTVNLLPGDSVRAGKLVLEYPFGDVWCGPGSFSQNKDHFQCISGRDQLIKKFPVAKNDEVVLDGEKTPTSFIPFEQFEFRGYQVTPKTNFTWKKRPTDGSLIILTLASPVKVGTLEFPSGTVLTLSKDELVKPEDLNTLGFSVKFPGTLNVDGFEVVKQASFLEGLKLTSGQLAKEFVGKSGNRCPQGAYFSYSNAPAGEEIFCNPDYK